MARFPLIDPKTSTDRSKQLLDGIQSSLGMVPNLARAMANAPAVLQGYLGFSGALGTGALHAKLRKQIALTVAEANGCAYCLSAHTAIGKMVGLSEQEIASSRKSIAADIKTEGALKFAREIVVRRGQLLQSDIDAAYSAGLQAGEIIEIIAHVALNIFTNYFNHIVQTDIDFPEVRAAGSAA